MKKQQILFLVGGKVRCYYAGVKLGIFDWATSYVKSTADIADELDLDDKLAYRLLRALSSLGFLKEQPDHTGFSITSQGELHAKHFFLVSPRLVNYS
jgi:Dimerisation domain